MTAEDARALVTLNGGEDCKNLLGYFMAETHYEVDSCLLNAVHLGVPKLRQR